MDKGAKLIVCDPRFTRSASKADFPSGLQPGADIALMGGIISPASQNNLYHRTMSSDSTNRRFHEWGLRFGDGLFPASEDKGYNPNRLELPARNSRRTSALQHSVPRGSSSNRQGPLRPLHSGVGGAVGGRKKGRLLEVAAIYAATGAPGKAGQLRLWAAWHCRRVGQSEATPS